MKYNNILDLITPTKEEIVRIERNKNALIREINQLFDDYPKYLYTKVIGSAATGNFLRGYRDIDAIIVFSNLDKNEFRKRFRSMRTLEDIVFSEKPSIVEDKVNGWFNYYSISVGAILNNCDPKKDLAADMLKHPDFTKNNLNPNQRAEVLLAKQFFKNIGLYGAKFGGFTVEQIIARSGTFENLLDELILRKRIFIDFSGRYHGPKDPVVVSYPYSGLDNLAKRVTEKDLEKARQYAFLIKENEAIFLEDTRRVLNRDFWIKRVRKYGKTEEFSMPDIYLSRKENKILRRKIGPFSRLRVLDVGCGNGFSTIAINRPGNNIIWGIDFVEDAIKIAKESLKERKLEEITFMKGDMTNLPFGNNFFDIVYAKRSLSNLPSRKEQERAIKEIFRVLRKDGKFLLFDLFEEEYKNMNKLRTKIGLDEIPFPYHGLLLDEKFIYEITLHNFNLEEVRNPTSTYYFMSRVVSPIVYKLFNSQPKPNSQINNIFSWLPSFGHLGINKFYLFRKR